jgi:hypothetical protein
VICSWAITSENDLLLIDLERRRMEGPDIIPALRRVYDEFTPYAIGIETGGAWYAENRSRWEGRVDWLAPVESLLPAP